MLRKKIQKAIAFCVALGGAYVRSTFCILLGALRTLGLSLYFRHSSSHLRRNQYDEDELEYWIDYRTEGSRGVEERDGVVETKSGNTSGPIQTGLDVTAPSLAPDHKPAGLKDEEGLKARRELHTSEAHSCCCLWCLLFTCRGLALSRR